MASISANTIIDKLAAKLAEAQVRIAMLEAELESAYRVVDFDEEKETN